ncbi:hypothetical protein [Bacillus sp. KH172YL63]|uniref:hypothetical protein n=1 Tax=Bacillus sp. KH172YL63 TaxID=2709784 RepID=UPI0013E5095E|nr:hypothetical protein [Bacillus sp. KH172YL63]BCB04231.1 hypothetical protein KH172YL63_23640 [Bacillus sp. KH172YL63]
MEKIIVKTGMYSFILTFLLLLIGTKRVWKEPEGDGVYTVTSTPYPDFFFTITRYSAIVSIISIVLSAIILYLISTSKRRDT